MATPNKGFEQLATGDAVNTWGANVNDSFSRADSAIAGMLTKTLTGADITITPTEALNLVFNFSGSLAKDNGVFIPATKAVYIILNYTTNGKNIFIGTGGGNSAQITPGTVGRYSIVYCNGTDTVTIGTDFNPSFRAFSPNTNLPNASDQQIGNYASTSLSLNDSTFNGATGLFTVGQSDSGVWMFNATCSSSNPNALIALSITLNGQAVAGSLYPNTTSGAPARISTSVVIRVNIGDTLSMHFQQQNSSGNTDQTSAVASNQFSGVRVSR